MLAIHIRTKNDMNGNPRGAYMVVNNSGTILDIVDEGYQGDYAVKSIYPNIAITPVINVNVTEYYRLLRVQTSSDS